MVITASSMRASGMTKVSVPVWRLKGLGDVARHFQMLALVLSHGHQMRIIQEDVRSHQDGIVKEAGVHIRQAVGFILEAVRIGQHGEGREAVEVPGELGAFGQVALGIENDFLRIQTTGQPRRGGGEEVFLSGHRILDGGQGVQISNEQERIVAGIIRQRNSGLNRTQHIAQMLTSRTLNTGENTCHAVKVGRRIRCCLEIRSASFKPAGAKLLLAFRGLWQGKDFVG